MQVKMRVVRDVNDLRKLFVHAVTFRLHVQHRAITRRDFGERVAKLLDVNVAAEFLAEVVARKDQRAARVFLLAQTEQIGRVTDLRLDLFLAVTEIIVGDDGDDDAGFVAAGQLERAAVVVQFVLFFPAHAVAALAWRGLVEVREADGFFRGLDQMRREDDAAGVAGPMLRVERGVIFRQQRITAVAENAFHEIQVAHQVARHEEADLHRLLRRETGNFRADQRTQEQRDETFRRLRLRRGEGQGHQFARRIEREREHFCEREGRHAELVVGDRQAALGDVKNSLRRAAVAARIVQHALLDAIRADDVGMKFITIQRQ